MMYLRYSKDGVYPLVLVPASFTGFFRGTTNEC